MASQALLKAVTSARFTQTRLLLQMGADVNCRDAVEGQTPLIHALFLQDPRVRSSFLHLLLRWGALVSAADVKDRNALMWACEVGACDDVVLLLRHADTNLNLNARNKAGQTALWTAVDGGKTAAVQELLWALSKQGMNFEVPDHWGVTPAMRAAMLGRFDCLRAMVRHLDDTATRGSRNTLLNVAKINQILALIPRTGKPSRTRADSQPDKGGSSGPAGREDPPAIRIISVRGHQAAATTQAGGPGRAGQKQPSVSSVWSLEFLREPTRCSTPLPSSRRASKRSPSPHRSSLVSPVPPYGSDERGSNRFPRITPRERVFSDESGASLVKGGNQRKSPATDRDRDRNRDRKRSSCTSLLSNSAVADDQYQDALFAPYVVPVGTVPVRRGSVRDSLPRLFEIVAQQTSCSFRRAAVKPQPRRKCG